MNGRQAAKLASIRIEDLENTVAKQTQDIKDYNSCIIDMIAGKSVCSWCEENRLDECDHASRGSAGCDKWWLKYRQPEPEGGDQDDKEEEGADNPVQFVEKQ